MIQRSPRPARLASVALTTSLLLGLGASSAEAGSARVVKATSKSVTLTIRANVGEKCTLTVSRRSGRIFRNSTRQVRFWTKRKRQIVIPLKGTSRPTARLSRCKQVNVSAPAPSVAPTPTPAPAAPVRAKLSAYDTVVAQRSGTQLTVYKGSGDRSLTPLYSASLSLAGWSSNALDVDGVYFQHDAHPFSADFSQVLFDGMPTGGTASHVGLLDLVTGAAVDLTAPRQGTGFSAAVLCEDKPGYLPSFSFPAGNGSRAFEFLSRTGTQSGAHCFGQGAVSFVDAPTSFGPIPEEPKRADDMTHGGRVIASEDGRYGFVRLAPSFDVRGFSALDGSGPDVPVDCVPDGPAGKRNEYLLGWTGPRTVALAVSSVNNAANADDWRTATLNPDGTVTCGGGIPATGKAISGISLSFDNASVLFSAQGPSGLEKYRQPLAGGAPLLTDYPELPVDSAGVDVAVYRVGPAVG